MNKPLILVVEDDPSVRNLITITLKTNDYRYVVAPNGSTAIMETTSHNPEIILLDLGLPDMDGVQVIQTVRSWSNVPIIVISARSEDNDKIKALDAGAASVDLEEKELKHMDITIASLHIPCMKPGTREENTEAYLNVMKNPYVTIIGHPDDGRYQVDYRALVQGAKEYGKILELNNHSLEPSCFRRDARENDLEMLKLCMEYQVPVVMDSDAHFDAAIGEFQMARGLLEEISFPEELVLNHSVEMLKKYVNKRF